MLLSDFTHTANVRFFEIHGEEHEILWNMLGVTEYDEEDRHMPPWVVKGLPDEGYR